MNSKDPTVPLNYLRVLNRRTRPEGVVDELMKLQGLHPSTARRRIVEAQDGRQFSRETLVAVVRAFVAAGDRENADAVFLQLIRRIGGAIANRMVRWNGMSADQMEDARQTVVLALYEFIYSLEPAEELWECNFKTCFDTRLITILSKVIRPGRNEFSMDQIDNDNGAGCFDPADKGAEADFKKIEVHQALQFLDRVDSRIGRSFYLKVFVELPDKEIADQMEVSERTVRNWIAAAKKELSQYFAER